ncbi:Uncharacterized protein Adt_25655 [Abeliophyllum distichum]|uniref:Uncharacterized protein n=1 Tax=Abeliophyllum distichum TaxID=126358 RepID=A0ABD1SHC3_9LAMI
MVDGVRVSYRIFLLGREMWCTRLMTFSILKVSMQSDKNGLGVTTTPEAALGKSPREFLAPMAQFDWNIAVPHPKGNLAPIPQFESGNLVTSEEETLALLAQLAWNIPVDIFLVLDCA